MNRLFSGPTLVSYLHLEREQDAAIDLQMEVQLKMGPTAPFEDLDILVKE